MFGQDTVGSKLRHYGRHKLSIALVLAAAVLIVSIRPFARAMLQNRAYLVLAASHADEGSNLHSYQPSRENELLMNTATRLFQRALSYGPSTSASYGLGLVHLAQNDWSEAEAEMAKVEDRSPLASYFAGLAALQAGNNVRGVTYWSTHPVISTGVHLRIIYLLQHKSPEEAVFLAENAVLIETDSVQPWLDLGEAYTNLAQMESAMKVYEYAATLAPENDEIKIRSLEVGYAVERDRETIRGEAIRLLDKVLEDKTLTGELNSYRLYLLLGQIAQDETHFQEAVDWLKMALDLPRVDDRWVLVELGQVYQLSGHEEDALEALEQALALAPTDARILSVYGEILYAQGRLDEAYVVLLDAKQRAPGRLATQLSLARVLKELGQLEEAISQYRVVLTLDPGNVEALRTLLELEVELRPSQ